jgi:hypothetical protein
MQDVERVMVGPYTLGESAFELFDTSFCGTQRAVRKEGTAPHGGENFPILYCILLKLHRFCLTV